MRRAAILLLAIGLGGTLSCADFPTKPLETVDWSGRITDRDGLPMAGVLVAIQRTKPDQPRSQYALTDSQGGFSATVTKGPYRVLLFPDYDSGYPSRDLGVYEIHGETPPLTFQYKGTRVSGMVTGPGGGPLSGAYVHAFNYDYDALALSGSGGAYSLVLPAGDYQLRSGIGPDDSGIPRRSSSASISSADTTIDFDLGGHEIRYVTTLNGSAPLTGARITATATGLRASSVTGPDGRARLYLPDGEHQIFVEPAVPTGFLMWGEELLQTVSGPVEFPIDLVRTRWDLTLRSSIDGTPIPAARIIPLELDAGGAGQVGADYLGRATLLIRPQHFYELRVYPQNSNAELLRTTIPAGADSTFDLLVPPPTP